MSRANRNPRQERLDAILESLLADDHATAQGLAERFGVSLMTVHRDLDELQRRGVVRKFRGGVSVERTGTYEIAAAVRRRLALPQKRALGAAAARIVAPGTSIMLDDSTTVATVIERLADVEDLRVVTNYLPGLAALTHHTGIETVALGGTFDVGHESFLGAGALAAVRGVRVDTLFLSTTTADTDGLYHQEDSIVALKTEMLRVAARRVLLLDSGKIGRRSFHLVADWRAIDDVLVDDGAPADFVDGLRTRGVRVQVVPVPPATDQE
ncbi:DeoR/GlpR family DNA-binding transcription regulator [Rhodococcus sp. 2H158]|nr:DeoR family transcriptional regulator [Rhodococcus rhodochrous]